MKCILWIRTSTDKQEVTSMLNDLYLFASQYGYAKEDCTVIGRSGASAIKADEAYKSDIEELYERLETNEFSTLFVWEISRLGRIEEYVIKLKNYLILHKIQLRVFKPQLYLLESDGSVNLGMELAISLFITLSKQEMQVKQSRLSRGKERVKREGKFSGARCVKFGYKTDSEGFIVIDNEASEVVKEIFNLYLTGMSATAVYKSVMERGLFPRQRYDKEGATRILMIVKDLAYAGEGSTHKYPAIVSKEDVLRCIELSKSHINLPKTIHKNIYFCKGLLYCSCGHIMIARPNTIAYTCTYNHVRTLNINVLDYIAWEMTKVYRPYIVKQNEKKNALELKKNFEDEKRILETLAFQQRENGDKKGRLKELYIDGMISKSVFEAKLEKTRQDGLKIFEGITVHSKRLDAILRASGNEMEGVSDYDDRCDDETKRKLILETLSLKSEWLEKGHYRISVLPNVKCDRSDWFDYFVAGPVIELKHFWKIGTADYFANLTGKWVVRFKRK